MNEVRTAIDFNVWRPFFIGLLIVGVFFRFFNLDKKIYWHDEVYTSLRTSGYTQTELMEIEAGREISVKALQTYQRINPEKALGDTIRGLAVDDAHPPLYFAIARFWAKGFGSSVAITRSLSAWISLLVFPCLYWLSVELFESSQVGWMTMALVAVSPFHVLYAQEARQYSFWTVLILLSSLSLLRAMRLQTKRSWGIYAATVALGLYCHFFTLLVTIAHGIYVGAIEHFRRSKTVIAYLGSSLLGFLAIVPWLFYTFNFTQAGNFTHKSIPFLIWIQRWLLNLSSLFLDIQISYNERLFDVLLAKDVQLSYRNPLLYLALFIVILIGYSLNFLSRQGTRRGLLFIATLIGFIGGILVLPDLVAGGQRSTISRYLIPVYLGIQLSVSYLLTTKLTSKNTWQRNLWGLVTIILVSLGILSCGISAQAQTWWTKYSSYYEPQVAQMINQATAPLVVGDQPIRLMSLSYLLKPETRFWLMANSNLSEIPKDSRDVFLFYPSKSFLRAMEQGQTDKLKPLHEQGKLWRLVLQ